MNKKVLLIILIFSRTLVAGIDREFVFDIHDAASTTEQYANETLIIPVYQTVNNPLTLSGDFAGILPNLYTNLATLLNAQSFNATNDQTALYTDTDDTGNTTTIIATSLGSALHDPLSLESFRRSFGRGLQEAEKNGSTVVHIAMPACINASPKEIAQEIATIAHMALYSYNPDQTLPYAIKRICVHAHMHTPQEFKDVNIGLRIGTNLGLAICQARDWMNIPASAVTPTIFAANAAQFVLPFISKIETIVFEPSDMQRMSMGGLLAVSQGSEEPCALVLHYLKARRPNVPTIALIGQGITRNEQGLTFDMSGATAVLTALHVIAYRNIPANILILAPLTEHTPDALALGDVLTLSDGKTVEISNIHAAGELMLADAFTYAVTHYHPDYIIDIATLTDACKQTFGGSYAGIMSNNELLKQYAFKAGIRTGELVWELPLNQEYATRLNSDNANVRNAYPDDQTARTQIAASFLQHYTNGIPWLHIDSAGATQCSAYNPQEPAAFGIRLLIDLVESIACNS